MTGESGDADALAGVREVIADAVGRLEAAEARDEALATFVPPHRVWLLFRKSSSLVPAGRVWRLGVFLLGRDGSIYATGLTTRAVQPGYPGYQSHSVEERRGYRAAAFAGPFARGETINFDATAIEVETESLKSTLGPLFLLDGTARVRWNASATDATAIDFGAYLRERVDLLLDPPEGA